MFPGTPLKHVFTAASDDLLMLAEKLLAMYPHNRCTATEALKMEYFSNKPAPTVGEKGRANHSAYYSTITRIIMAINLILLIFL